MPDHSPPRKAREYLATLLDEKPGAGPTRRQKAALAAVWAAGTLLLLLFRPGYLFPPFRVLDGWIYTSYQWDLVDQIKDFGPTYYGSRLSWILPGALVHSFLPLVVAQLAFKLLVSGVFAAACAFIVLRQAGFRPAVVAVALSVLCPGFIAALHSDYIDTAVIVYGTLALACITAARDSRRWPLLIFLGGCFYAGMVIANLSALASLGAGIAVYHLVWLRWGFWRHAASVALYAAAAALLCVLLGLIHRRAGGDFNFLQPQIGMISYMRDLKVNPWIPTDRWWFVQATWLVVPVGILLWGGFVSLLAPPAESRLRELVRALTAGLAVSFSLALYLQARELNATLSFQFYASFHLSLALPLAAVCLVARPWPAPSGTRLALFLAALLAVILFWDADYVSVRLHPLLPFVPRAAAVPLFFACLILTLAALLAALRHRLAPAWQGMLRPELLLLGLITCSVPVDFHGPTLSDHLRERYVSVHAAYRILAREFPAGSYRYWVHPGNDNGISLASTKLWGFRLFTLKRFPEYDSTNLADNLTVVIPAPPGKGPEVLAQAEKVLAGPRLALQHQRIIPVPGEAGTGFDLACFSLHHIPIDPEDPAGLRAEVKPLIELRADATPPYPSSLGSNLYGPAHGDVLAYTAGYPVFTRTHPDDHLATDFKPLHPAAGGASREVSLIATMPADGHAVCVVQTQDCTTIARLELTKAGRTVHMVVIPPDATSLRIYLQSSLDRPTPLPTRIAVYELPAK